MSDRDVSALFIDGVCRLCEATAPDIAPPRAQWEADHAATHLRTGEAIVILRDGAARQSVVPTDSIPDEPAPFSIPVEFLPHPRGVRVPKRLLKYLKGGGA